MIRRPHTRANRCAATADAKPKLNAIQQRKLANLQWLDPQAMFEDFDTTKDGSISVLELREGLRRHGVPADLAELVMKDIDEDGDQQIDAKEWQKHFYKSHLVTCPQVPSCFPLIAASPPPNRLLTSSQMLFFPSSTQLLPFPSPHLVILLPIRHTWPPARERNLRRPAQQPRGMQHPSGRGAGHHNRAAERCDVAHHAQVLQRDVG